MADLNDLVSLQDVNQLSATLNRVVTAMLESSLLNVHTILPAIVTKFDGNLIEAQPTIKRFFLNGVGWQNLPISVDCPVIFPSGGGMFLTFPIQPGDECLLFFSERSINGWFKDGGISIPVHMHTHDTSDAFAFVGVNSRPNKLTNVQTDGAELRTRDRSTYIKMSAGLIHIKGDLQVEGNITATEEVEAQSASTPVHLSTHVHTGVTSGSGSTGGPVG